VILFSVNVVVTEVKVKFAEPVRSDFRIPEFDYKAVHCVI